VHWRISVVTTLTRIQQLGCHLERNISCLAMPHITAFYALAIDRRDAGKPRS